MSSNDSNSPPRILYPANVEFPCFRANSIQIVHMAHAMARNGARVTLIVRRASLRSAGAVLEGMGLSPHPNLRIVQIPVVQRFRGDLWEKVSRASFYPGCMAVSTALALAGRFDTIFLRLDTRRVQGFFRRLRDFVRGRLVFECHELMFQVVANREIPSPVDPSTLGRPTRKCWSQERALFGSADGVVFMNRALERDARRHFPIKGSTCVLPSGTGFKPVEEPQLRSEKHVFYCGHLLPSKGVGLLIEALAALPDDVRLTIVGGGKPGESAPRPDDCTADIEARARALGVRDRVRFTGFVNPVQVPEYVSKAGVVVVPTRDSPQGRYNSPLKLFEYMALGKPIVASDLEGIREVLEHERNALLFRRDDADDLAAQLRRLLDSPSLQERLARQALSDAAQYTWENRAAAVLRFIESLRTAPRVEREDRAPRPETTP
ncbi:glycosyltransferase family 4 protein [Candidatus Sumerlaeota bacterium]|nr:glycosyltransferase family 4 protein [Candidatus Sumerlaeota bacterium]